MTSSLPVAAVSAGIASSLTAALAGSAIASLIRVDDLAEESILRPALTVLLYRVDVNHVPLAARPGRSGREHGVAKPAPLDLRYLVIAWGVDADQEQTLLGSAMQALLDQPVLVLPESGRAELTVESLSTDVLVPLFGALGCRFRPSIALLARASADSDD